MTELPATALKLLDELREGKFEHDCGEIKLVQRTSDNPESYSGPGVIWREPDGSLRFKLFAPPDQKNDLIDQLVSGRPLPKLGKIYADEDHFAFAATTWDGKTWWHDRVLVGRTQPHLNGQTLVTGNLDCLTHSTRPWHPTAEHSTSFVIRAGNKRDWEWLTDNSDNQDVVRVLLTIAVRYRVAIAPGHGASAFLLPGEVSVAVPEVSGSEAAVVADALDLLML